MTGVAGPVKGVAGGGASSDGLSSCHIGGVNLPAAQNLPPVVEMVKLEPWQWS